MGKEFVVETLEQMCDLMCGGVERDDEDDLDNWSEEFAEESEDTD